MGDPVENVPFVGITPGVGVAPPVSVPSGLRAAYAKHLMDSYLRPQIADMRDVSLEDALPHQSLMGFAGTPEEDASEFQGRVCIVGAGVAGLQIAMLLKYIGVPFDIVEASGRIGGRCYTYPFDPENPNDPAKPHNYYDIGAMRIPAIPTMDSTMELIELLNLQDKKVPYYYSLNEAKVPQMHWYSPTKTPDDSAFSAAIESTVADFVKDFDNGFEEVMNNGDDNYSTRSWLMLKKALTYEQTLSGESADTSTGLFDQAFTESICDYSDFQAAKGKNWYRLEGGMSVLTDTMHDFLKSEDWPEPGKSKSYSVTPNKPVTAMSYDKAVGKINVTTTDPNNKNESTSAYEMVFNTTAMAPLQRMDLSGLGLPDEILTGIRTLSYDRATKVAIKFKTPWWRTFYTEKDKSGGVSSTDLPISNVVYPSWDDGPETETVLMVSYSWAQDATRMGALVPDYTKVAPNKDETLVTLCLQNLVKLFESQPNRPTFGFLYDQYVTHHAWAWSHDPYTGGAFALFGPGQFKNMYPHFQFNFCDNKLALCGEALSAHHAWISGAIDSAYAAVFRWLLNDKRYGHALALKRSKFGGGKDKHPEEVSESLSIWASLLSRGEVGKATLVAQA